MKPERKYEKNIMTPSFTGLSFVFSSISMTEDSDKKDPAPIEVASTTIAIMPAKHIWCLVNSPAEAMPNRIPKVETRLSSAPKIKFLYSSEFGLFTS